HDARDKEGRSAFFKALLAGHHAVASHLRDKGAAPSQPDAKGDTALHVLAASGSPALSNRLYLWQTVLYCDAAGVSNYPIGSPDALDASGRQPWMVAAAAGHAGIVRRLLEALPAQMRKESMAARDAKGKTGVELAREAGKKEVVACLESLGLPEAPAEAKGAPLAPALAKAIEARDAAEVEKLLKAGTSVAGVDARGRSSLLLAVEADSPAIATLLIQRAAKDDPDLVLRADKEGRTPARVAAKGDGKTLGAVLVGLSGAFGRGRCNWHSVLAEKGKDGKSALEIAQGQAKKSLDDYAKEQLDIRNGAGLSGAEDAADRDDAATILALRALGAKLDAPGNAKNALMVAAEKGHIAAVAAVLESLKDGERAAFLERKADTTPDQTARGWSPALRTALEMARAKGHHEAASLIERAKARK
ncbi:MAG: ankyrin repeat domain-containing protein, partial [Gemmataceae bacterium]|nr:ankyrin repeat domain-containing protein [Gemmataceae bacterium]